MSSAVRKESAEGLGQMMAKLHEGSAAHEVKNGLADDLDGHRDVSEINSLYLPIARESRDTPATPDFLPTHIGVRTRLRALLGSLNLPRTGQG